MAKTNNLVLMGDCADPPCEQADCGDATTVDVVAGNRRLRLSVSGYTVVWTSDFVPSPQFGSTDEQHGAAFCKSFPQTALIYYTDFLYDAVVPVDIATGEADEAIFVDDNSTLGITSVWQESEIASGVGTFTDSTSAPGIHAIYSISPEGALDEFAGDFGALGLDDENLGGVAVVSDRLYFLEAAGSETAIRRIVDNSGDPVEELADLSDWIGGDDSSWMLRDDVLQLFYVCGYAADGLEHDSTLIEGEFVVLQVTDGGAVSLLTHTDAITGKIQAFTLHDEGLYWIEAATKAWFLARPLTGSPSLLVERTEGDWPVEPLNSGYRRGYAFVVGVSDACNQDCACGPGLTLQRVIEAWPGVESCAAEHAETEGLNPLCCAATEEVAEEYAAASCRYVFDYEITLCEGRTLDRLVVQGARGRVGVWHEVDDEWVLFAWLDEIADFSTMPLVGRLQFDLAEEDDCGPHTSTLRVTAIDSANCCTRVLVPLECCRCCEPAGSASLTTDAPLDGYSNPHQYGGLDTWGTWNHSIEWVKLVLPETISLTDCTSIGSETAGCFLVEFDGAIMRDDDATAGGTPWADGYYPPNTEFRIKHDAGALGDHHCIKVTPIDPRGCPGPTQSLPLPYAYSLDPDEDPPTGAPWEDFFCEGWP